MHLIVDGVNVSCEMRAVKGVLTPDILATTRRDMQMYSWEDSTVSIVGIREQADLPLVCSCPSVLLASFVHVNKPVAHKGSSSLKAVDRALFWVEWPQMTSNLFWFGQSMTRGFPIPSTAARHVGGAEWMSTEPRDTLPPAGTAGFSVYALC